MARSLNAKGDSYILDGLDEVLGKDFELDSGACGNLRWRRYAVDTCARNGEEGKGRSDDGCGTHGEVWSTEMCVE